MHTKGEYLAGETSDEEVAETQHDIDEDVNEPPSGSMEEPEKKDEPMEVSDEIAKDCYLVPKKVCCLNHMVPRMNFNGS